MSTPCRPPIVLTITVGLDGLGTGTVPSFHGRVEDYAVDAPADNAAWNLDFTETFPDGHTHGRGGISGQTGDITHRDPFFAWHDLNANFRLSTPGVYYVIIWHRK